MTRLKKHTPLLLAALLLAGLPACKPTEKNYRAAYETATQRRQAELTDPDFDVSAMISDELPARKRIGQDSAYVRHEALTLYGPSPSGGLKPCNVAVARYKMITNAEADAAALRRQGLDAFLLRNNAEELYVIIGSFEELEPALAFMRRYMKENPQRPYVGLPSEPVIEIPLGSRF